MNTETPVIRRRARSPGTDKARTIKCPDDVWEAALEVAHARGMSLGSCIVAMLEKFVASRP